MKKLPLLCAALLVLLALVETAQGILGPRRVPTDEDWRAAASVVRAELQGGDLIVFAPAWCDQIGRFHLGDKMPAEMAARADADRYGRVWVLSQRGAEAEETAGARLVKRTHHGRLTVTLYEKPAARVLFDFTSQLGASKTMAGQVEARTLEIDYRPRRGLLAPAPSTIEWPAATLGSKLVGYTGLHDYFSRKNADGPVDFAVLVDGVEKLRVRHGNGDGWRRFELATPPGPHAVRFEVTAQNRAWRTFGFHAEARE